MSRIACIHIEKGKLSNTKHIPRELPTVNSIFSQIQNQFDWNSYVATTIYRRELRVRSKAYTARTNQKLQKNVLTHLSAVINLDEKHNIYDIEDIVDYLEDTLDTVVFQRGVHKDEGHWDNGKPVINYHAHLEMMGIDSQGYSIRRKLTKKYLSQLQTKVAMFLQMPRGKKNSKNRRLGTYEYKEAMRRFEKERTEIPSVQNDLVEQHTKVVNKLITAENFIQSLAEMYGYKIWDTGNDEELGHLYDLIYSSRNTIDPWNEISLLDDGADEEDVVIQSVLSP